MKKKKLVFVGFAFKHHLGTHSGYHQIRNYLKYDVIISGQKDLNFVFYDVNKLPLLIVQYYRRYFGMRLWFTELRCIFRAVFFRNQVFHIIYGENILKHLGRFKGSSNEIVCTYHQPASVFEKNSSWKNVVKDVNKVIIVTSTDINYFKQFENNITVKYIPHGVNTDFYVPTQEKKERSVMMVGNWLRDFSFANNVFVQLLNEDKEVKIYVVSNAENFNFFVSSDRLFLESNISDELLRNLYQRAGLIFLPLIEFTANNSILEAAACGAEILVATNSPNTSYFDASQISFLPFDQNKVVGFILNKLNKTGNSTLSNTRNFVVDNYSWQKIAKITREYLES